MEIDSGVFVGKVSAVVRDILWEKCREKSHGGRCCQLWRSNNEQGFSARMEGYPNRNMVDFEGLVLVSVQNAEWGHHLRKGKVEANE